MKYIFQIPIILLMLWASGKSYASHCVALSGGDIEAYVTKACSPSSHDGAIRVKINGTFGPFELRYFIKVDGIWKILGDPILITQPVDDIKKNLNTGEYMIVVIDNRCAMAEMEVEVGVNDPINISATPEPICKDVTGIISPVISGGQPPYTFLWSNGATSQNISDLHIDWYYLTVTDTNGCTSEQEFEIGLVDKIVAISHYENLQDCVVPDGKITISNLVDENITYRWYDSNGVLLSTNKDITGLKAGEYTLIATSGDGCITELKQSICCCEPGINAGNPPICYIGYTAELSAIGNVTFASNAQNNGSITLQAQGGKGQYNYIWTGPNGFTSSDRDITNLVPGVYIVKISDGCKEIDKTFNIGICTDPVYNISLTQPCPAKSNGAISITKNIASDIIKWDHLNATGNFQLNNLPAGMYCFEYTVRSTNCKKRECIELLENTSNIELVLGEISPVCKNENKGIVTVTLNTLLNKVTLKIDNTDIQIVGTDNGKLNHTFFNLSPGSHKIKAYTNCTEKEYAFDIPHIEVTHSIEGTVTNGEEGPNIIPTGEITVAASGGSGDYFYQWSVNGVSSNSTTIEKLKSGNYTVTVVDLETGCHVKKTFNIQNTLCPNAKLNFNVVNNFKALVPFAGCQTFLCDEENCVKSFYVCRTNTFPTSAKLPLKFELYQFESEILETIIINTDAEYQKTIWDPNTQSSNILFGKSGIIKPSINPYFIKITDACNTVQILKYTPCNECSISQREDEIILEGGLSVYLHGICKNFDSNIFSASQYIEIRGGSVGRTWKVTFPDGSQRVYGWDGYNITGANDRYNIDLNEYQKLLSMRVERSDGCTWDFNFIFSKTENVKFYLTEQKELNTLTLNGPCNGCAKDGKPRYEHGDEGDDCDNWYPNNYQFFEFTPNSPNLKPKLAVCNSGGVFKGYQLVNDIAVLSTSILVPPNKCQGIASDNGGHSITPRGSNLICTYGGGCLFKTDDLFPGFNTDKLVELTWCSNLEENVVWNLDEEITEDPEDPDTEPDDPNDPTSMCPKRISLVSDEKGNRLRIFSFEFFPKAELVFSDGDKMNISLTKGINFIDIKEYTEGKYDVVLNIPECPEVKFNFEISKSCPNAITLDPVSASSNTTIRLVSKIDIPGSKILILKSGKVLKTLPWDIIKGTNTKNIDLADIADEGNLEIKVVYGNSCTAVSRNFNKEEYCPSEGELQYKYETSSIKFWPFIFTDQELNATFTVSKGVTELIRKEFKISKGKDYYEFIVDKSLLEAGAYYVRVEIKNKKTCDIGWNFTYYHNLISCDENLKGPTYNDNIDQFQVFSSSSFEEFNNITINDILSSGDITNQTKYPNIYVDKESTIIKDNFNNFYVLSNIDEGVLIKGFDINGANKFIEIIDGYKLLNSDIDKLNGHLTIIAEGESKRYYLLQISTEGEIMDNTLLNLNEFEPEIIHQIRNNTIAYSKSNGSLSFSSENSIVVKYVPSDINIKDIKSLDNGRILVAGDFKGQISIGGKSFDSDGHNNAIFITYDNAGNILASQSEQNYRDETVEGIATKGNEEVAYHGRYTEIVNYASDPSENVVESCIFVNIVALNDPPCTILPPVLSLDEQSCNLDIEQPQLELNYTLQHKSDSIWSEISGATFPYTPEINGEYRISASTSNCPTALSEVVDVNCIRNCHKEALDIIYNDQLEKFQHFYKVGLQTNTINDEWISPATFESVQSLLTLQCENIYISYIRMDADRNIYIIGSDPGNIHRTRIIKYHSQTMQVLWSHWIENFKIESVILHTVSNILTLAGYHPVEKNWYLNGYLLKDGLLSYSNVQNVDKSPDKINFVYDAIHWLGENKYIFKEHNNPSVTYKSPENSWTAPLPPLIVVREFSINHWNQVTVGGEFFGSFTINDVLYESGLFRSLVFITYNNAGQVIHVNVIKSDRHYILKTFANNGYYRYAYTGYVSETAFPDTLLLNTAAVPTLPGVCVATGGFVNENIQSRHVSASFKAIRFYPNPFSKGINLDITSEKEEAVTIETFNTVGTLMFNTKLEIQKGQNVRYIDAFERIPTGVYIVKIKSNDLEHLTRVIRIE